MKKCIKYLFILPVLSLTLLVNDAYAVNYNVDLVPVQNFDVTWNGQVRIQGNSWTNTSFPADIPIPDNSYDIITKSRQVGAIWTRSQFSVTEGNYYEILIEVRSNPSATQLADNIMPLGYWENFQSNNDFDFITIDQILDYTDPVLTKRCELSVSNSDVCAPNGVVAFDPTYFYQSQWFKVLLRAKHTGSYNIQFGNIDQTTFLVSPSKDEVAVPIRFRPLAAVVEYKSSSMGEELEEMNQKDDQDRSDIQSQSSDVDSGADDSQEAAESTGQTLLGAFTGFVGAITSATPSNCNIDMDLGNLDLGTVNFCQLSPPREFQALASIFMILFCVPLSIATARKVINLFRSFQG